MRICDFELCVVGVMIMDRLSGMLQLSTVNLEDGMMTIMTSSNCVVDYLTLSITSLFRLAPASSGCVIGMHAYTRQIKRIF
jgi:hypothetical protein